ncbi:carboxypeptidase-like regulatory domain-containing protein [Bacteroides thetaiotaomicron]|nr:carboxypeptidase-like regulatory domain-containing protein [Bacteroides thetaiotaomicron]
MVVANHYSGVSPAVKGTTSGTIRTDLDGKFSISNAQTWRLILIFLLCWHMNTQDIKVQQPAFHPPVTMKDDAASTG